MSHTELARPGIAQIAQGFFGTQDEEPRAGLLVWRVRFWLLALAVGLLAANAGGDEAPVAPGALAAQSGCSVPATRASAKAAGSAVPARTSAHCAVQVGQLAPRHR